jgi:endogenous inhibitor of DNA gyrase (YacG/DUF329 family)
MWMLMNEMRDEAGGGTPHRYLQFTCPTCKRRVCILQEDPRKLPRFFPFCSERCKLIDLGAWLDADYRIVSKPDEEEDSESPVAKSPVPDSADLHP